MSSGGFAELHVYMSHRPIDIYIYLHTHSTAKSASAHALITALDCGLCVKTLASASAYIAHPVIDASYLYSYMSMAMAFILLCHALDSKL